MAFAPSIAVSVECVSICHLSRGGGSGAGGGMASWRHDCSAISCAWKAPRALTGSLATTTQTSSCSCSFFYRKNRRRDRSMFQSESPDVRSGNLLVALCFTSPGGLFNSRLFHLACRRWRSGCLSSSIPESSSNISPESLWKDLKPTISYLPPIQLDMVHKALKIAFEAHNGQKRRSGEPFIIHPVEVAHILGELELDWESIAAGLLHDTVEDTNLITFERIERDFGTTVRHIVEGETKVSKLGKVKCKDENNSAQDIKADDLRQMFLAMTEEVRVIIVKLADRLHNMRTLSYMPPHKQASIASETLQIFAPLAKLLGMYNIKAELENLSFMYLNPHDHDEITIRVAELYKEHEKEMVEAHKVLTRKIVDDKFLDLMTVKIEVRAGCKELYSIYKAILNSKSSINEINQIAQLQIIIKPKPCAGMGSLCSAEQICYHVLGLVHSIWTPVPQSMKDYIATPKPNGYQSLHTTVIPFLYESTFRMEVQIRTEEMDLIAQRGIAAHYSGKALMSGAIPGSRNSRGKSVCFNSTSIALRIGWLNAIREWQEEFVGNMSSREFVDIVTRDLLGSRVFVFTPRGEIKNLPQGATVVDYAYMIHTEVGNKMEAAKVNGNLVDPTHVLANAEVVEIITYDALSSKAAYQRQKEWLQHAKTRSARHKIMKFLREQAALSAAEITWDSVTDLSADSEKELVEVPSELFWGTKPEFGNIRRPLTSSEGSEDLHLQNGSAHAPNVNGFHEKHVELVSLNRCGELFTHVNGMVRLMHSYDTRFKELVPGFETWRSSKVAAWHSHEGHSIQWLSVVCVDRRGMMADVTRTLAGISVCSCVAEMHRGSRMTVMLFQIEGSLEDLVDACLRIDLVHGVLEWSMGCSWMHSFEDQKFLEC
ncbi:Putative GTP diphosphokinase rsh1, chloroplastic [Dionaea muscipula]